VRSQLIREGIEMRMGVERAADGGSVLDIIRDLAGSVEGPSDLGSNPRHLRGFGR
jgi:hypothetical protein